MATWGPLPDLVAWLRDASRQIPFVLALVDHEGGDITTYSADDMEPEREASVGERSKVRTQGPRRRLVASQLAALRRDDLG